MPLALNSESISMQLDTLKIVWLLILMQLIETNLDSSFMLNQLFLLIFL